MPEAKKTHAARVPRLDAAADDMRSTGSMAGVLARTRRVLLVAAGLASPWSPAGAHAGRALCAAASSHDEAPIVVVSAFPAELAPLVRAATIESTVQVDGREFKVGRLEGVRVALGLTGIGLINAADRATSALKHFKPAGIVMSGVAGSPHFIGDVVVPARWEQLPTMDMFPVNPAMLQIAKKGATMLPTPLEDCATVPPTSPSGALVCMPNQPQVVFGDLGQSSDPYGGKPLPCTPGAGEIFGCELPTAGMRTGGRTAADATPEVDDMETAEVARAAAKRHVPFVAMRAVSDGAGDPKGDRGFPTQFFDYYRLSADNAAIMTRAFLAELSRLAHDRSSRRICRLLAQRRWQRAGALLGG